MKSISLRSYVSQDTTHAGFKGLSSCIRGAQMKVLSVPAGAEKFGWAAAARASVAGTAW
jgi:hypothetical protein